MTNSGYDSHKTGSSTQTNVIKAFINIWCNAIYIVAQCNAEECMFMQIMNKCGIIWMLRAALWRLTHAVWQQTQTDQRANEMFVRVKKAAEGSCPMMFPTPRLTCNHRWKELLWQVLAFTHPPSNLICCQTCNTVSRHQWWGGLSTFQTSVMNVKAKNSWRLGVREGRRAQWDERQDASSPLLSASF